MRGEILDEDIRVALYQSCQSLGRGSLHLTISRPTVQKLIMRLSRLLALDIPGEAD
jgi:hypothetical protein